MRITFLNSSSDHPIKPYIEQWIDKNSLAHEIKLCQRKSELRGGKILFLISCSEILTDKELNQYSTVFVLHASDLPKGRGWNPHIWEIIAGAEEITLSLLEAAHSVDSGPIYAQTKINIPKHALWDEINTLLFESEIQLIDLAVSNIESLTPRNQSTDIIPTYYPKRSPDDSQLDPNKSITEQFDTMRICDPNRFPAFFKLHGQKYKITLEKVDE